MTSAPSAPAQPRAPKLNLIGLEKIDYKGNESTLCNGCGHDSISAQIIAACFEMSVNPTQIIKMSGIGCSSKTPAYFLNRAHGFNSVHGRMPSMTTGATLANRSLLAIGVSGDGDTGSIGLGQFKHMVRRNVPVVYIIEDNGVYGLTKGQFSATADEGQKLKYAGVNELPPIDLCMEALVADCTFVARSFSGDPKQVQALLKAAMSHGGTAVIDIISPCVTFNNHDESTKSYSYGRDHEIALQEISYVPKREEIVIEDYPEGSVVEVQMHDGSVIRLKKVGPDHDPTNRLAAMQLLDHAKRDKVFLTGLIYVEEGRPNLAEQCNLVQTPLAHLTEQELRPSREALAKVIADLG
ncbi:MAG TPA: 2-oxoacid:ferredoxin oxidoreductase subunit beta [Aggregatilineales bacterium]|nr:2-oxoacid:ferredoxin oxidoreductase subunit beta [Aggregatilineales bacterium]